MTNEEMKKGLSMVVDGATYDEVADELGITKQAVQQAFNRLINNKVYVREAGCVYPNIYNWLRTNRVTKKEMANRMNISYMQFTRIINATGTTTKERIDQILEITGLTYEEAFYKKEDK